MTMIARARPGIDDLLADIADGGSRICALGASEGAAGNISICLAWDLDLATRFADSREIELPAAVPALAGRTLLVTGSGCRLRQICDQPLASIGALRIAGDGATGRLWTGHEPRFERLTSELNSHLAVHNEQVERRGVDFHALVHAQPRYLTYLSHVPVYHDEQELNRRLLRWQPETIIVLPEGIRVLDFRVPGSRELQAANVEGLRSHQIVLWGKHGVMARSDVSVANAVDRVDYAETAAHYEYLDLVAGGRGVGLTGEELRRVATAFGIDTPWAPEEDS
jgi:rhamnulose-1-phosphate aldolase